MSGPGSINTCKSIRLKVSMHSFKLILSGLKVRLESQLTSRLVLKGILLAFYEWYRASVAGGAGAGAWPSPGEVTMVMATAKSREK